MSKSTAAVLGGGVIGGGWVARFALMGWDVRVFDPDPQAARKVNEVLENARQSLPALYEHALPTEGAVTFVDSVSAAVSAAAVSVSLSLSLSLGDVSGVVLPE